MAPATQRTGACGKRTLKYAKPGTLLGERQGPALFFRYVETKVEEVLKFRAAYYSSKIQNSNKPREAGNMKQVQYAKIQRPLLGIGLTPFHLTPRSTAYVVVFVAKGREHSALTIASGAILLVKKEEVMAVVRQEKAEVASVARPTFTKRWETFYSTTPAEGTTARFSPTVGSCLLPRLHRSVPSVPNQPAG